MQDIDWPLRLVMVFVSPLIAVSLLFILWFLAGIEPSEYKPDTRPVIDMTWAPNE